MIFVVTSCPLGKEAPRALLKTFHMLIRELDWRCLWRNSLLDIKSNFHIFRSNFPELRDENFLAQPNCSIPTRALHVSFNSVDEQLNTGKLSKRRLTNSKVNSAENSPSLFLVSALEKLKIIVDVKNKWIKLMRKLCFPESFAPEKWGLTKIL